MSRRVRLEAGLWGLASLLVLATLLWPGWTLQRRVLRTRETASEALQRLASAEHEVLAARGRYVAFGPAAGEREAALPGVALGAADTAFAFDGMLDGRGTLRLRAVSRPEAIRDGRVAPFVSDDTTLAGVSRQGGP